MFGEWRERLQGRPSRASWARQCELLLEAWLTSPHAVTEQWLPYARAYLGRWPEKTRCTPSWAIDFMLEANALHLLDLAGCVELDGIKAYEQLRVSEDFSSLPIAALTFEGDGEVFSTWSASILAHDTRMANIERFSLRRTRHDAEAWKKVDDGIWLSQLQSLELDAVEFAKRAHRFNSIFRQIELTDLRSLLVRDTFESYFVANRSIPTQLVQNQSYEDLRRAEIWHLQLTLHAARAIAEGAFGAHLESLYLHQPNLESRGWEAFVSEDPGALPELRHLHIDRCELVAYRLKTLFQSPWARRLEHLQLTQCSISDDRYELILDAAREMPSLEKLDLDRNYINDDCLIALSNHDSLSRLDSLEIEKRWGSRSPAVYEAFATSATLPAHLREDFARRLESPSAS